MVKIKDLPKHKRPREKLLEKGPNALKDYELLAILLRTGYQGKNAIEVAKRILKTIPFKKLANLPIEDLAKLKGVGKSSHHNCLIFCHWEKNLSRRQLHCHQNTRRRSQSD